jgi:hypothetical protein
MTKIERFLLKYGLKWLLISLEPYRLIEWHVERGCAFPTEESLEDLRNGIVKAWHKGKISRDDAVRRFFAGLLENTCGYYVGVRFEWVEVHREEKVLLAYHTCLLDANERVIDALKSPPNDQFFSQYCERYDAVGHYYFKIPDILLPEDIEGYFYDQSIAQESHKAS